MTAAAEIVRRTALPLDSPSCERGYTMSVLDALVDHVAADAGQARAVVWAHNSHLGDARATSMSSQGSMPDSYERLFHDTGIPAFALRLHDPDVRAALNVSRTERALDPLETWARHEVDLPETYPTGV